MQYKSAFLTNIYTDTKDKIAKCYKVVCAQTSSQINWLIHTERQTDTHTHAERYPSLKAAPQCGVYWFIWPQAQRWCRCWWWWGESWHLDVMMLLSVGHMRLVAPSISLPHTARFPPDFLSCLLSIRLPLSRSLGRTHWHWRAMKAGTQIEGPKDGRAWDKTERTE